MNRLNVNAEHKDKIDRYHVELNQQIKRLEQQASTRPANLVDASSDQALSDKMSAVTSKFNTLIAIEQRQIAHNPKVVGSNPGSRNQQFSQHYSLFFL